MQARAKEECLPGEESGVHQEQTPTRKPGPLRCAMIRVARKEKNMVAARHWLHMKLAQHLNGVATEEESSWVGHAGLEVKRGQRKFGRKDLTKESLDHPINPTRKNHLQYVAKRSFPLEFCQYFRSPE